MTTKADSTIEIVKQQQMNSPIAMLRAAKEAGIDPKDIQGFLDVQINWEKREAEKEYNAAMSRVHAKVVSVAKTALNPQTKSRYSELDNIVRSVKPIYTEEGFSVSFYEGDGAPAENVRVQIDICIDSDTKKLGIMTFHWMEREFRALPT